MSVLEEHRRSVLAEAAADLGPDSRVTAEFFDLYYRHVLTEDLVQRQPEDLRGIVLSHRALAQQRRPGETLVRSFTPTVETHGWATGNTVVQVVSDDRPFIVDSLTEAIGRQDQEIRLLVHPRLRVAREPDGAMTGLDAEGVAESWVHLEVGRLADQQAADRLVALLQGVLADVAAAVGRLAGDDRPGRRDRERAVPGAGAGVGPGATGDRGPSRVAARRPLPLPRLPPRHVHRRPGRRPAGAGPRQRVGTAAQGGRARAPAPPPTPVRAGAPPSGPRDGVRDEARARVASPSPRGEASNEAASRSQARAMPA